MVLVVEGTPLFRRFGRKLVVGSVLANFFEGTLDKPRQC